MAVKKINKVIYSCDFPICDDEIEATTETYVDIMLQNYRWSRVGDDYFCRHHTEWLYRFGVHIGINK